jgi:hypothetical protein
MVMDEAQLGVYIYNISRLRGIGRCGVPECLEVFILGECNCVTTNWQTAENKYRLFLPSVMY